MTMMMLKTFATKPLYRSALPALAMAAGIAIAVHEASTAQEEKKETPSVLVKAEPLEKKPISETITAYGSLTPDVGGADNISLGIPVQIRRMMVSAGQSVKQGQPLFEIALDAAAAAAAQQAATGVSNAKEELTRTESLLKGRLATQSQVAAARKALQDAESNLAAQQAMRGGMRGNTVTAPRAGVVATITAQQGDRVPAGGPILQLTQAGKQRILLGVEPEAARRVHVGMPVRVVSLFDDKAVANATVTQILGIINPQTRMVDVAVQLKSVPEGFYPGAQVEGDIVLSTSEQWVVARSAILHDDKGSYVYQVAGTVAKRVTVTPGLENGEDIAVKGTLDPAKKVVVSGNYELHDNMALRVEAEGKDSADESAKGAGPAKAEGRK